MHRPSGPGLFHAGECPARSRVDGKLRAGRARHLPAAPRVGARANAGGGDRHPISAASSSAGRLMWSAERTRTLPSGVRCRPAEAEGAGGSDAAGGVKARATRTMANPTGSMLSCRGSSTRGPWPKSLNSQPKRERCCARSTLTENFSILAEPPLGRTSFVWDDPRRGCRR